MSREVQVRFCEGVRGRFPCATRLREREPVGHVYEFIAAEKARWPVRRLCVALEVSRSAFYDWLAADKRSSKSSRLDVHIRAIHRRSRGTYGSPRVHAELVDEGWTIGVNRVAARMQSLGLSGIPKRKKRVATTVVGTEDKFASNALNREFSVEQPNQAWVADITYLATDAGWVYLSVLIDLHSRRVVGWAMADHMETRLCLDALHQAVALRQPPPGLLHHSDRGTQYTSYAYQAALTALQARPSMSRKGNCWDNAVAESFFGTLEQELVRQSSGWADLEEAKKAVADYIHAFYNRVRRHSNNGQRSPVDFELAFALAQSGQEAA